MIKSKLDCIYGGRVFTDIYRALGLWHWQDHQRANSDKYSENNPSFWQRYKIFIIHGPLTMPFITMMFIEAFTSKDMIQAGDTLYMSFAELAFLLKFFNMLLLRRTSWHFINDAAFNPIFKLHSSAEETYWRREQKIFRSLMLGYVLGSLFVGFLAFAGVLVLSRYELPFAFWFPLDIQVKRNYWLAYGFELVAIHITALGNSTADALFCYFMLHIAMLYKVVGLRLSALQDLTEKQAIEKLLHIFKMHRAIKRLTVQCEKLITWPMLGQIFFSALILCFTGYRMLILNFSETPGAYFAMLQFLSVMLLQIFLPCYYANEVTVNAWNLTTCVYKSNWTSYSVKTRKMLILYMEFLKRPVKILAGGYFAIGLPIFMKVINNAYSVFAILLNTQKK